MTTELPFLADCRARLAFDLLAHTWDPVVLWALRAEPVRYGQLRVRIGGISAKVLTEALRRLEFNGLAVRNGVGAYELTPLGRTLLPALGALGVWAVDHGDAVLEAQDDYRADR
ncbi:winged helix-turn-helix transcriptional regulator [Streptomyces acidiscabies]|uniref:HxlR family transcriptional regulator n=1 Tax=Streptomyces acidiscabies TaxID=42234 RepID=A0A0L0KP46_9ACTN|nr:helix-turn-helix domain-containing protein [Streptomyces acidiscabies]KND39380.1 HxlR family transcriptional regulator [Streptomyces acidiscabies]